jgi:hypothetical protein
MSFQNLFSVIIVSFLLNSCKEKDDRSININIHEIGGYLQSAAVWGKNDTIYSIEPINTIKVDSKGDVVHLSTLHDENTAAYFIEISDSCEYLLFINSNWVGASSGTLKEISLKSGEVHMLLDSTENVSSAVYYRDTDHIIFYSFGKPVGMNPGYFMLHKHSGERQLLYAYISPLDLYETVNGFDLHPFKDELLIPITHEDRSPSILLYNFATQESRTIFNEPNFFPLLTLWLRYNSDGTKVLYTSYPIGLLSGYAFAEGECGIIDMNTLTKKRLDVNTSDYQSETFCANWSPDNKRIVFSSAPVSLSDGVSGPVKLYILNKFNP